MKPGSFASTRRAPDCGSICSTWPRPPSSTCSRPPITRGECGIDSPDATTRPDGTSITMPLPAIPLRQPNGSLLMPSAVTKRTLPSANAMPFRWHLSSGAVSVTNGGCQIGVKLK